MTAAAFAALIGGPVVANAAPELVVARGGTAVEAGLDGGLGRTIATGRIAAVSLSRFGTLWVGTHPDPNDAGDLGSWEPSGVCGYTAIWGPWPSSTVDLAQYGQQFSASGLVEATDGDGPACTAQATPNDNLTYMREFLGSGTSTYIVRMTDAGEIASVDTFALCWSVTFSRPNGPIACLTHDRISEGGMGTRIRFGRVGRLRTVGPSRYDVTAAAVSPTGTRYAFILNNHVWVARPSGSGRQVAVLPVPRSPWPSKMLWTANGRWLLVQVGRSLWKMPVAGGSPRKIMTGITDFTVPPSGTTDPSADETPERFVTCTGAGATNGGAATFPKWMNLNLTNATGLPVTFTVSGASSEPYTWVVRPGQPLGDWSVAANTAGQPVSVSCSTAPSTTVSFASTG